MHTPEMAQTLIRYANPLCAAQAELARMTIVWMTALALICAGQAPPF